MAITRTTLRTHAIAASLTGIIVSTLFFKHLKSQLDDLLNQPPASPYFFDSRFWYSSSIVHPYLTTLGPRGRELYQSFHTVDWVMFPLIYGTGATAVLDWAWGWK
ncbi:hypothetical protein HK104_008457, partial [Borealophlyctis nickersoniae]